MVAKEINVWNKVDGLQGKKVAVIRFPGSNCDFDALNFFRKNGYDANFLFHSEKKIPSDIDIVFLPGGFAYGDREYEKATGEYKMNPGVLASKSNIIHAIREGINQEKFLTYGVCNGFQILLKIGILPGDLEQNNNKRFYCNNSLSSIDVDLLGIEGEYKNINIPVAHGYGKYVFDEKDDVSVFVRYKDNPNGSMDDIAGVCDIDKRVFGMMPHPERSGDSKWFFQLIEKYA